MKKAIFKNSFEEVFNAVIFAADKMDLVVSKISKKSGQILLEHGGSLFSFGNKISIKIFETKSGLRSVRIESSSSAGIQLIDWGTNSELEKKLVTMIKRILN